MPEDHIDDAAGALASSRGRRPLERPRQPGTSPTFLVWAGVVLVVFGGVVVGLADAGFIAVVGSVIAVGTVLAGTGIVAVGVRLGNEWTDYDRATRER